VTTPEGPANQDPSPWARTEGSLGPPPEERPTERIGGLNPSPPAAPTWVPGQTDRIGAPQPNAQDPGYQAPPIPNPAPTQKLAAPIESPPPVKRKRRFFGDPLSILLVCIIVAALVIAGLVGVELYARQIAKAKVTQAVACEIQDQATASLGVTPLMVWQYVTNRYTNISVQTAGNQIRDAKGMKLDLDIRDVRLKSTPTSKGTIGSVNATVSWTSEGIKESVQNAIPVLGAFVTNSVTAHPADNTIELKGMLDDITAKPVVSGNGLRLQIDTFNALGFTLPKESAQTTLDEFTSTVTDSFPLGIHADSVQVTDSGVSAHFSAQNASIPAGNVNDRCFAGI